MLFFFIGCYYVKSYPDTTVLFSDWLLVAPFFFFLFLIGRKVAVRLLPELQGKRT